MKPRKMAQTGPQNENFGQKKIAGQVFSVFVVFVIDSPSFEASSPTYSCRCFVTPTVRLAIAIHHSPPPPPSPIAIITTITIIAVITITVDYYVRNYQTRRRHVRRRVGSTHRSCSGSSRFANSHIRT